MKKIELKKKYYTHHVYTKYSVMLMPLITRRDGWDGLYLR
jgi:hypothetical protein